MKLLLISLHLLFHLSFSRTSKSRQTGPNSFPVYPKSSRMLMRFQSGPSSYPVHPKTTRKMRFRKQDWMPQMPKSARGAFRFANQGQFEEREGSAEEEGKLQEVQEVQEIQENQGSLGSQGNQGKQEQKVRNIDLDDQESNFFL